MKSIILPVFIFMITLTLFGQQLNKSQIENAIKINELKHPYLLFNEKSKTDIIERTKSDRETKEIFASILAEGNRLLYKPVEQRIPEQGKNPRADWTEADRNGKYESYYHTNLNNAIILAFLYQLTDQKKYAEKSYQFADAFCELPTWTLRAHEFPIIYGRVMPWNVPDDQVSFSFDHYNGDAGREMAYVYDWLFSALNQLQRDRLRGALLEKVITKVRGNYEFHWWATAYRCNWCGVCNSGTGMAALAILKENPQLIDVIAESYNRINLMYNELGSDGGWQEGPSYWSYALRTSVQFAKALQLATNGKYDLFKNERFKNNPATFPLYTHIPPNRSLNFEDSRNKVIGPTYLINLIANETSNDEAIWYRQNILGEGEGWEDIVWSRPKLNANEPQIKSKHFRTIDFWVMRSDFKNSNKVIVGGKAGKNDDPHHGHLDIGNFVVFWNGVGFISEFPQIFYDEKYFDEERWNYPSASSLGHNVIFVNNEKQVPGKLYKKPYNYEVGGEVILFESDIDLDYVIMDATKAYPMKELKGWKRHIQLDKKNDITIVYDEIKSNKGAEIEARFHSEVNFKNYNDFIILSKELLAKELINNNSEKPSPLLNTMALIPIIKNEFTFRDGYHTSLPVNETQELKKIPYFGIVTKALEETTAIVTLILPIQYEEDAKKIVETTKVERNGDLFKVSFQKGSETFLYSFKQFE